MRQNQIDIDLVNKKVNEHYKIDRVVADLGIKVIGTAASYEDLIEKFPAATFRETYGETYGAAFKVGEGTTADYYVLTRPDINSGNPDDYWLNIGNLIAEGPQGEPGKPGESIKGDTGERGSKWYVNTTPPVSTAGYMVLDVWLNTSTGDVYQNKNGISWTKIGNIKGRDGANGLNGNTPIITISNGYWYINGVNTGQPSRGEKGQDGEDALPFHVEGVVSAAENLPEPTQDIRAGAYLVGVVDFDLYVIVGPHDADDSQLSWFNAGKVVSVGQRGPGMYAYDGTITTYPNTSTIYNYSYSFVKAGPNTTVDIGDSFIDKEGNIYLIGDNLTCTYTNVNVKPKADSTPGYTYDKRNNGTNLDLYLTTLDIDKIILIYKNPDDYLSAYSPYISVGRVNLTVGQGLNVDLYEGGNMGSYSISLTLTPDMRAPGVYRCPDIRVNGNAYNDGVNFSEPILIF